MKAKPVRRTKPALPRDPVEALKDKLRASFAKNAPPVASPASSPITFSVAVCYQPKVEIFIASSKAQLQQALERHKAAAYALVTTLRDGKAIHAEKIILGGDVCLTRRKQ